MQNFYRHVERLINYLRAPDMPVLPSRSAAGADSRPTGGIHEDIIMTDTSHDPGVIHALVERFNTQRLPRAMDLKKKVDAGATLGDHDMQFLDGVFRDIETIKPLVNRNPEYQKLVASVIQLYKEILDKAMENEKKA
jgi:hypothetical protein